MRNEVINIPIKKLIHQQVPEYKLNCLSGAPHPLDIESVSYRLTQVGKVVGQDMESDGSQRPFDRYSNLSEEELYLVQQFSLRPEMEWAIANSFDGLYIDKYRYPHEMKKSYTFHVYRKEEHITYWKLKFN